MYAIRYKVGDSYYERVGFLTLDAVDYFRQHKTSAYLWDYYRVRPYGRWERVSKHVLCHNSTMGVMES